jgi:hypothetical protein
VVANAANYAGSLADAPGGSERCPMSELMDPSPWRDEVVGLARDYESGVVEGWPHRYAAPMVEGVRYLIAERDACQGKLMDEVGK